jgi:hypothetical protein
LLHTQGVAGSNPAPRTIRLSLRSKLRRGELIKTALPFP